MPEDYKDIDVSQVDSPTSLLHLTAQAVLQFTPLTRFGFPRQWVVATDYEWTGGPRRGGTNVFSA